MSPNKKMTLLDTLPDEWPYSLLPEIQKHLASNGRCLVVLDDDPTGTQTVYDTPVLTDWAINTLQAEFEAGTSLFYILTNSRSLSLPQAAQINLEIGQNLKVASGATGRDFVVVSRSDSTLRGHFPGEVDALRDGLEQAFDGWLIVPYFLEGGRLTVNDVHYVTEGENLIPAADTPFAQDKVFGYRHSNLRQWVMEKSNGRIQPHNIFSISLTDIRQGGPQTVAQKLAKLYNGQICIVNAVSRRDMEVFVLGLLIAEAQGKRFLYRTAASFVQTRAGLAPKPLLTTAELALPATGGGLVIVGSYVPKTTQQVAALLAQTEIVDIQVDVEAILSGQQAIEIERVIVEADKALNANQDVVIYTSRTLVTVSNSAANLIIGQRISDSLVAIVAGLKTRPRYLLAKGGITSSDVATAGLNVKRALVVGQILPGVPVWQLGPDSRYPGLAYIVFPGNVGQANALGDIVHQLQ